MATLVCPRCRAVIDDLDAEYCWWCQCRLCYACWAEHDHCGPPEAERREDATKRRFGLVEDIRKPEGKQ